jgi:chromate reductase
MKLGIIVGSLRRGSYSRQIAENVAKLLPGSVTAEFVSIDLAMFNQDYDDDGATPESWTAFRSKIKEYDAFLFVTPEYNRGLPPVLKNALDIGSRPYGKNAWAGKKAAIISISPGSIGGFGANHSLRQVCVFLDIAVLQQPEMYIGSVANMLGENGEVGDESRKFLQEFVTRFMQFAGAN